jgi:hypothetical protein
MAAKSLRPYELPRCRLRRTTVLCGRGPGASRLLRLGFSTDELKDATVEAIQLCLPDGIKIEDVRWSDVKGPSGKALARSAKRRPRRVLVCA